MGARDADADLNSVGAPPSRPLPPENRLDALFPEGRDKFDYELPDKANAGGWDQFFRGADKACTSCRNSVSGWPVCGAAAIRHVLEWIIRHQDADGAWGGIQPPWIYSLMALYAEGYSLDHPVIARGIDCA